MVKSGVNLQHSPVHASWDGATSPPSVPFHLSNCPNQPYTHPGMEQSTPPAIKNCPPSPSKQPSTHPGMEQSTPPIYQKLPTQPLKTAIHPSRNGTIHPSNLSKTAHPAPQNSHPPIQEWNNPPLQSIKNCPPSPSKQPSTHPGMEQSTPPIYLKLPTQPLKTAIHPSRNEALHSSIYQTTHPATQPASQLTCHQSIQEWHNPPICLSNCPPGPSTIHPPNSPWTQQSTSPHILLHISITQLPTACECYSRYVNLLAGVGHHLKAFTVQHLETIAFARRLVDAEALDVEGQEPGVAHGKLSPHREVRHQQFAGWFLVRYCNRHRLASDTPSPDTLSPGSLCTFHNHHP